MKNILVCFLLILASVISSFSQSAPLRIIMIGAHPADCDQGGGGTAIILSSMGHAVKFVSVTNGDAGHQTQGGGALAKRRIAEAQEAGKRFGVTYDVLDNHDGELTPTLDVVSYTHLSVIGMVIIGPWSYHQVGIPFSDLADDL